MKVKFEIKSFLLPPYLYSSLYIFVWSGTSRHLSKLRKFLVKLFNKFFFDNQLIIAALQANFRKKNISRILFVIEFAVKDYLNIDYHFH